jgi:hypothetical protein
VGLACEDVTFSTVASPPPPPPKQEALRRALCAAETARFFSAYNREDI